jgi:hypothetical protein
MKHGVLPGLTAQVRKLTFYPPQFTGILGGASFFFAAKENRLPLGGPAVCSTGAHNSAHL